MSMPAHRESDDMTEILQALDRLEKVVRSDIAAVQTRLESLEKHVTAVETDVAVIKATMATREELAELRGKVSQLPNSWQMIVGAVAFLGFAIAVLKYLP